MNFAQARLDENDQLINVRQITPDHAKETWPDIEHLVEKAMRHSFDDTRAEHVLKRIEAGELFLVVITKGDRALACACLELLERVTGRTCHCMIFAGEEMEHWVDAWMMTWGQIAKDFGCDKLSIKGRPGWARYAAKRFGFKHQYTIMTLDLNKEGDL